ncbi:alpha/beta fold hydrolase [Streptomyces albidoflavus]
MKTDVSERRAAVLRAWRATLEAEPASDDENFFEAGGNSILVVELQRRLSAELGHRVPLRQLHDHPTVAGLVGLDVPSAAETPTVSAPQALTLYCLPYAGAAARIYEPWRTRLPDTVEVVPLELPGRGSRWSQRPQSRLPALLEDLAGAMDEARRAPYAVFGHSFGGILAYELVRHVTGQGYPPPVRLLVSACPAPHLATPRESTHDLSDEEFTERLRKLRGTPEELLENEELMELYLPTIRADYTILDAYRAPRTAPLGCPVTAFCGADDHEAGREQMAHWAAYGDGTVDIEEVTGDHFFLRDSEDEFLEKLAPHLRPARPPVTQQPTRAPVSSTRTFR